MLLPSSGGPSFVGEGAPHKAAALSLLPPVQPIRLRVDGREHLQSSPMSSASNSGTVICELRFHPWVVHSFQQRETAPPYTSDFVPSSGLAWFPLLYLCYMMFHYQLLSTGAEGIVQLIECYPSMHKVLHLTPSLT